MIRHIQNLAYAETCHTWNPGIFRTLPQLHPNAYSESCQINESLRIFRTLTYLKSDKYSKPSQKFKIEIFAKIVKKCNYFSKMPHLRSLTRFWIRLSINKYPLNWRVTSRYELHVHIQNLVYYRKFRYIQAYSRPNKKYSAILQNI